VETYEGARTHGIGDQDIRHGVENALVVADDEEEGRVLCLGPDRAGTLLEIVSVLRDDDSGIVIHAMPMRRTYEPLLRERGDIGG
jgi:hypothetical protein